MYQIVFVLCFYYVSATSGWEYIGNDRRLPPREHRHIRKGSMPCGYQHNHICSPPHHSCHVPNSHQKCNHNHLQGSMLSDIPRSSLYTGQFCQPNTKPFCNDDYLRPIGSTRCWTPSNQIPSQNCKPRFPCKFTNNHQLPIYNVNNVTPLDCYKDFEFDFSKMAYEVIVKQIIQGYYCSKFDSFARLFVNLAYDSFAFDLNQLLIFTAISLHNTSGFKYMENVNDNCNSKYRSRGILMITTKPNYELLAMASNDYSFITNPEKLAGKYEWNIIASIKFWNCFLGDTPRNYHSIVAKFAPQDAQPGADSNEILLKRKCARREIYEKLASMLSTNC